MLAQDWTPRARQLAEQLTAAGKLTSAAWRDAVCAVPRHEFVPEVFRQDRIDQYDETWRQLDTTVAGRQEWLDQVYSPAALITALDRSAESPRSLSTSSMPGLMTRMLETLDVRDGNRVLEIGTGTGYNAGLLSHRLGDTNVFSVDIEPDLITLARQRLARLGYHPTLVATNGADGLLGHAPFDRIIATCAVPAVPWAWVIQTRPDGVILTDLKPARGADSLVRLTRCPDRAEGRFDPTHAAFMVLRHQPASQAPARPRPRKQRTIKPQRRTTTLDPRTPLPLPSAPHRSPRRCRWGPTRSARCSPPPTRQPSARQPHHQCRSRSERSSNNHPLRTTPMSGTRAPGTGSAHGHVEPGCSIRATKCAACAQMVVATGNYSNRF